MRAPNQLAEKIFSTLQNEFSLSWPEKHNTSFVESVSGLLTNDHHSHNTLLGMYRLLLRFSGGMPPKSSITQLVFRIMGVYHNATVYDSISKILADSTVDPFVALPQLYVSQKRQQALREQHGASLVDYVPSLQRFGYFLKSRFKMRFVPPIEPSKQDSSRAEEISAYTDGESLFLPNVHHTYLDGAKAPGMLNSYYLYYLMGHEQAHLGLGTFDIALDSEPGKQLFNRFTSEQKEVAQKRLADLEARALERRQQRYEDITVEELRDRTGYVDFLLHFEHEKLASALFNILEDARIEKFFSSDLPGLFSIQESFSAHYEHNYRRPPELRSADENLLHGLLAVATNQAIEYSIEPAYEDTFAAAKAIIEQFLSSSNPTVYDSCNVLIDLYRLLEKHRKTDSLSQVRSVVLESIDEAFDIALRRKQQLDKQKQADLSEQGEAIQPLEEMMGYMYPEFDGEALIKNAVSVQQSEFKYNAPKEFTTVINLDFSPVLPKTRRVLSNLRRYHEDGDELDFDLIPDFMAARHAGSSTPIAYNLQSVMKPSETWILLDVSVSMEAPRKSLGGREAMTRAKEIAEKLTVLASTQHSKTRIFAGIDAGRRKVMLHELTEGMGQLASVRAISVGGFRSGALLRHLNRMQFGSQSRRRIFVISDGAPSYLNTSKKAENALRELREQMCVHCSIRHDCVNEAPKMKIPNRLAGIWRTLDYQYRDLRHAIDHSTPASDSVYLLLINDFFDRTILDRYVAPYWCDATIDSSLLAGLQRISEYHERSFKRKTYEEEYSDLGHEAIQNTALVPSNVQV